MLLKSIVSGGAGEGALPAPQVYDGVWCPSKGHKIAASEEAFVMMTVKLEMGFTNIDLVESFRFSCDAIAGYIYQHMVNLINNKANGLLLGGAACLHCWVNLFPVFAEKI